MAKRIGKYKVSKREAELSAIDGGTVSGNLDGIGTLATTGNTTIGGNIIGGTNAADNVIQQFDGTEVARIHDGGVVPSATGTSTSLAAGTGMGWRRRVLTLGSGNDDNVLTLTAADSGAIVFVTPTNAVTLILPLIGTETGFWIDIIMADKINKAFLIKTSGQDGADNISVFNQLTAATGTTTTTADVGAADHDILTFTNALEGSRIELINVAGGAAEKWHAYIRSLDTVVGTIA